MAPRLTSILRAISQCDNDVQKTIYLTHLLEYLIKMKNRAGH